MTCSGEKSAAAERCTRSPSPQLLAIVEWDEGPRFSTELVDVEPDQISIGMRVAPVFCDYPEAGITLLRYRPADQSGA